MKLKALFSELRLYICNHIFSKFPFYFLRNIYYKHIMLFHFEHGVSIHLGCKFHAARHLQIGKNSVINSGCRIDNRGGIKIGNNVSISTDTIILTADHDINTKDFEGRIKFVLIEDYVWVGTRAMILPGVKLGFGSVVAAGAVVTKDVYAFEIVAGVPAKKIGERMHLDFTYSTYYKRLFQ